MTPREPGIAFVLLAAGRSVRFGSDKLTASYEGRPLWEWAAAAAEDAGFQSRLIVVGRHSRIAAPDGWRTILNHRSEQGMGTSIAAAVSELDGFSRVVIALADMPLVTTAHLRELAARSGAVFTRQNDGTAGSPAAFPHSDFEALRGLTGDKGARSLNLPDVTVLSVKAEGMLFDVDTVADLQDP